MPQHCVMDRTGDTRHVFSANDAAAVAQAEARFRELTGKGFIAISPGESGKPGRILKSFEPQADVIFQPQLIGG